MKTSELVQMERGVLCRMVSDAVFREDALALLNKKIFIDSRSRAIYQAIFNLEQDMRKIDPYTVAAHLNTSAEEIYSLGGNGLPISLEHVNILCEKARARILNEVARQVNTGELDTAEALEALETAFSSDKDDSIVEVTTVSDVVEEMLDPETNEGKRIRSGIAELDDRVINLRRGKLAVIGARPGIGKTAMMISWLVGQIEQGYRVCFNSWEPEVKEIKEQLVFVIGKVDSKRVITGRLTEEEKERVRIAGERVNSWLKKGQLFINRNPSQNYKQMLFRCRKLNKKYCIDIFYSDYLQAIPGAGERDDLLRLGNISYAHKLLAQQTDALVVLGAQLNKEKDGDELKDPNMSRVYGSTQITAAPDVILILHRETTVEEGKRKIIIVKQRRASSGFFHLAFEAKYTKFSSLGAGAKERDFIQRAETAYEIAKAKESLEQQIEFPLISL